MQQDSTAHQRVFTRRISGKRQRSRRFPVVDPNTGISSVSAATATLAPGTGEPLRAFPFTRYSASGRRQRSKRFLPTRNTAFSAELSVVTQLLAAESEALPFTSISSSLSLPQPRTDPVIFSICAEPELLSAEYAAPSYTSSNLAIDPPLHVTSPAPVPLLSLPYECDFPSRGLPRLRPNTDPRANAAPAARHSLPLVHSSLKREAWEFFLRDYPDRHFVDAILHIIDHGSDIVFTGPRNISQASYNLSSALEHPDVVTSDLQRQVENGCTRGPFPSPPIPFFRSSPLGVVARKQSGKLRRIHHLSWPRGSSVNDGIPDGESSILYETFTDAARDIIASGAGSWLVKLDLEQAFRQIPVRPDDWPLLGFTWGDQYYHEIALTLGIHSAPYIFNLFSEALHWILQHHLPARIRHLLDDFLQIFTPDTPRETVQHALEWSLALGSALGLRFQPTKIEGPTTALDFLGITLDTIVMEARLPPEKLAYLSCLLQDWQTRQQCSLHELQELTGYLQFCAQVIPFARAFLRSLFDFSATFTSTFSHRHIPRPARRDITWWCTFSSSWNGVHLLSPHREVLEIYTDASGTKGAGGIFGSHWFSVRFPRRYLRAKRDIKFKEFYAIIYAILCWGPSLAGRHIIFYIDNQNVDSALHNLSSTAAPIMELLRQFLNLACRLDFTFESRWIPTSENSLADAASRFQFTRLFTLAPYLDKKPSSKVLQVFDTIPSASVHRPTLALPSL